MEHNEVDAPNQRSLLAFEDEASAYSDSESIDLAFTAEDYLRNRSATGPLDSSLYSSMDANEQLLLLQSIDKLEEVDGQVQLGPQKQEALAFAISSGTEPRSIWTKNLESGPVFVVNDKSDLPDLEDVTNSATDWLHSTTHCTVAAAFPTAGCASYQAHIDVDATTLLTDTLSVVKAPIRMHVTPHENLFAEKIKHTWRGESLSSKINFELGSIDSRLTVLLVLPQFNKSHPQRQQIIRALYKKLYAGIKRSAQAGSSGLKKDLDALMEDPNARTSRTTVLVSTFNDIESELKSFRFNHHPIEVLWVFQYFGDKFNIAGEEAISGYLDYLGKLFDLSAICDPTNERAQNVVFTQDIALTISSAHNSANPISIAWNPLFSGSLGSVWNSALRGLLRFNKRHEHTDANVRNGRTQLYTNLGVGALKSAMIDWHSDQVLVKAIKAYFSGSEYWRNNAPYANKCFAVLGLPMENILSCSAISDTDQALLLKQKKLLEKTFNAKSNESSKIGSIMGVMHGSSYGARLEITLQNTDKEGLLEAYEVLLALGDSIIKTHVSLADLYDGGQIPFESLRHSPIQVIDSRSLFSLAGFQANLINSMFTSLFNCAIGSERDDVFNPDIVNGLALLENVQQLLWSGSLLQVNNPALVNRLSLLDYIDEFGRVFIPQTVFHFNDGNPLLTVVNLPAATTPSEEPFMATQLALSRRCFRRAFGGSSTEFLRVFTTYSSVLQLFILPRQSFFTPLFKSKTNIMAANILNMMFTELFDAMDIPHDQHLQLFAQLCFTDPVLPPSLPIQLMTASISAHVVLENLFELDGTTPDCLLDTKFAKLWRLAYGVIPYLTSTMKWSSFAEFRSMGSHMVDVKPIVRIKDVRDQMLVLLHQSGLRFIPVLGSTITDGLVLHSATGFLVGGLTQPYYSSVLPNNNRINGIPLPHPVDGSFIYMVAENLAKRLCQSRQQREEFLGHVLYHYTKLRRVDRQSQPLPCPRYRVVTFELLAESGLLFSMGPRCPFELLSLNELYQFHLDQ